MDFLFFSSFIIYLFVLVIIGVIFYQQQHAAADFTVGSRSLNYWVTAVAAHATDMSTWLFMAFPGLVYRDGIPALWTAVGLLIGMYATWNLIAPKIRVLTESNNTSTLPSFLEAHYQDTSGMLRIVSALLCLVFFTFYISAGIVGLGQTIEVTFGINYHMGILIGTLVVGLYTLLGGFLAVAWNDFLQGLFVLLIIVLVPLYATWHVGGPAHIMQVMQQKNISLNFFPHYSVKSIISLCASALGWGLGYFGLPHVLINFMGIKNPHEMKKARNVGMLWQVLSLAGAASIGLIGIAYFATSSPINSEHVFILMSKSLFPSFIAGLVLCGILAAATSTMDSQILVSASVISEDLGKKIFHKKLSEKHLLLISRLGGLAVTFLSFCLAFNNDKRILDLVYYAWSGLGGSFGPIMIATFYCRNISRTGALAGILSGALTSALWPHLKTPFTNDVALIPAFIVSFASIFIVSALTNKKHS